MPEMLLDILGIGVSTVDDLMVVETFPTANDKMPVLSFERQGGGLTSTALVAAARLGRKCRMILRLGEDELSRFIRSELIREGIGLHETNQGAAGEIRPCHSVILTEKSTGERAIMWRAPLDGAPRIGDAEMAMLDSVGCLFVDNIFAPAIIGIAEQARKRGIPVVGDFERPSEDGLKLMELTDHLILPLAYAKKITGAATPEAVVRSLAATGGRALACVTDSERGSWYWAGSNGDAVRHQPAFKVERVVDATGCGDVFHGAYAAFLVAGLPPSERIRRASAAAAIKAGKVGAQKGSPTRAELEKFLAAAI